VLTLLSCFLLTRADECAAATAFADDLLRHEASGAWAIKTAQVSTGTTVFSVDNFLPPAVAADWYTTLNATWAHSEPCRRDPAACVGGGAPVHGGGLCSWLYTTNSRGGNAKIRSVFRREERRRDVEALYKRGAFAYSKWELTAGHPLYRSMGEMMATRAVRETLARVSHAGQSAYADGEPALGNISDYFVTAYGDGDFLSTHSDGASGSLAWVLHLSDGMWDSEAGGALRFNRGSHHGQLDFAPSFNRLLMFLTRPDYVPHQVTPTKPAGAEPRFGMTGWYMVRGDRFSASTLRENEAMRAAASKASAGDVCL